ncbi:hypothetical protein B0H10DRAFT_1950766 [Mycena sp. CBHHK59/15]|nr:hypothetical protein B0H10DRAFT_1950766 [Mycena sp. CBHHK59/15]
MIAALAEPAPALPDGKHFPDARPPQTFKNKAHSDQRRHIEINATFESKACGEEVGWHTLAPGTVSPCLDHGPKSHVLATLLQSTEADIKEPFDAFMQDFLPIWLKTQLIARPTFSNGSNSTNSGNICLKKAQTHRQMHRYPVSPMATRPPIHETHSQFLTGITVTCIYINSSAKDAFMHLFNTFFAAVKQVTSKSVWFKVFHPKGNLYSIHFDMEAAQVQGLGTWLSKMVLDDPALCALFPSINPDDLVKFILKLCSVHLER